MANGLIGKTPEHWNCIDCRINTAPGVMTRVQMEQALSDGPRTNTDGALQEITKDSEIYMVTPAVWKAAGMTDMGGCLCIGCLEKRLGRTLMRFDFPRSHPLNNDSFPCTERLRSRREVKASAPLKPLPPL